MDESNQPPESEPSVTVPVQPRRKRPLYWLLLVLVVMIAGLGFVLLRPSKTDIEVPGLRNSQLNTSQATIALNRKGISPATLHARRDTVITWVNQDSRSHELVFAKDNDLNSGKIEPKGSFTMTFEKRGTYEYRDANNAAYRGSIIVE